MNYALFIELWTKLGQISTLVSGALDKVHDDRPITRTVSLLYSFVSSLGIQPHCIVQIASFGTNLDRKLWGQLLYVGVCIF